MKTQLSLGKWFILFATLALGNSYGFSQVTQPMNFLDWTGTAGSQNFFQKNLTKTDGSGNVYVCGATINGNGDYDLLIAKYNNSGVQQWINQYAGAGGGNDFATGLWIDGSSNVYVTGSALNSSADSNDVITIKYNSSGTQQWAVLYNGGYGNDGGSDITVDGSGNVYVSGATNTGTSTYFDGLLIKYNSSGTQQYVKTFDNNNLNDGAYRVSLLTSNRVAIACIVQATSTTYKFASVRYTATTGAFIASSVSASLSIGFKMVTGCVTDAAHNMYVTGWEYNVGTGFDYRTIKLDSALNQIWTVSFDGASHQDDQSNGIAMDGSGNVYVTGYSTGANGKDYATVKYNSSGTQQWVEYYNDPDDSDDVANAIVLDNNGLPVVTGYHYNGSSKDYHTIKYDASGAVVWSSDYNGLANKDDRAFDIACDGNNDIFVTGQTQTASLTLEYTTVKYTQKNTLLPHDTVAVTSSSFVFTENRGQLLNTSGASVPQIRYYTITGTPNVALTDTSLSYIFAKLDTSSAHNDSMLRVDMRFLNANSDQKIHSLTEGSDYYNFFLSQCPTGLSRVQNYSQLISFNVWNNVDMIYGSNSRGLKYYFICRPGGGGGAYANIDLKYDGADSVKVDGSGRLVIYTKLGKIIQPKAAAWQVDASGNYSSLGWQPSYNIVGTNEVKFTSIGSYNTAWPLIMAIDWGYDSPQNIQNLEWSTYYGAGGTNLFSNFVGLKVAPNGQVLACGSSNAPLFPLQNALQVHDSLGGWDAIVVKFEANGKRDWATFYGGTTDQAGNHYAKDFGRDVDVDTSGNVFFVGSTQSVDFPTHHWASAYFDSTNTCTGVGCVKNDQFIVQLDPTGQLLKWSTLYGGTGEDRASRMAISPVTGDIYMVGYGETGFPLDSALALWNSHYGTGTIVRFNSFGGLVWATKIGSVAGSDGANDVAVDRNGDVIVTGQVGGSLGFPIYQNACGDSSNNVYGGYEDGFITKFTKKDNILLWSTFYGGYYDDHSDAVVADSSNNYFITGYTQSNYMGALPLHNPGGGACYHGSINSSAISNAFIGEFDQNGCLVWSTYYGGSNADQGMSLALDSANNLFMLGYNSSTNIPFASPNLTGAYVAANTGSYDASINCFQAGTHQQIWTTYFGGVTADIPYAIAARSDSALYIAGATDADGTLLGFPLDNGGGPPVWFQDTVHGNTAFISRFVINPSIVGIAEYPKSEILDLTVYPNPAQNSIWIQGNIDSKESITIEIFDLLGQKTFTETISPCTSLRKEIYLSDYANGIYVVHVHSSDKVFTRKIIVRR